MIKSIDESYEFLLEKDIRIIIIETDNFVIDIYFKTEDTRTKTFLEAKYKGNPIGGIYSIAKHSPHTPSNKTHYHVYAKNNEIFAINIDGTAHDNSHGITIPNEVFNGIKKHYPLINIPKNKYIEMQLSEIDNLYYFKEVIGGKNV